MSRYQENRGRKQRRRLLIVLPIVVIMIVAAAVLASGAVFTASSFNVQVLTAGNLKHINSKDSAAIIADYDKLKPGDVRTDTVMLTNDGDFDGQFYLSASNLTQAATAPYTGDLSTVLVLLVEDLTSGATVYSGPIDGLPTTGGAFASLEDAGIIAAGASHNYRFTVTWPDGGVPTGPYADDNAYKLSTMSIQFDWSQVQL